MLEFRNFGKNYGNKKAVSNLNLTIEDGDIYAFVGHNGAGKTTTLKAAAGILPFEEGDILVDGVSIIAQVLSIILELNVVPFPPTSKGQ